MFVLSAEPHHTEHLRSLSAVALIEMKVVRRVTGYCLRGVETVDSLITATAVSLWLSRQV